MKIKVVVLLLITMLFWKHSNGQPIDDSNSIIKLIKLSLTEQIDVVKQELKACEYKIVKENRPYELDGIKYNIDIKFDNSKNYHNFSKNDYNHKLYSGYSIESNTNFIKIWFLTYSLDFSINRLFSEMKKYFKTNYDITISSDEISTFYFRTSSPTNDFYIMNAELIQLPDFLYNGYSSLVLTATFRKPFQNND